MQSSLRRKLFCFTLAEQNRGEKDTVQFVLTGRKKKQFF